MLLVDHGIFRLFYANCHKISDKAWRSAQPAPHHIRRFADAGIRTIVNLRGERQCGSYWLEEEACARHGLKLVNFQIRSRAAPTREELLGAKRLFEEIEYPDADALQVGRRPRRPDERALSLPARRRAAQGGDARALLEVRPHPPGGHRHPRLLLREVSRRQRRAPHAVLRLGRHRLRPRRAQAHVPIARAGPTAWSTACCSASSARSRTPAAPRSAPASARGAHRRRRAPEAPGGFPSPRSCRPP